MPSKPSLRALSILFVLVAITAPVLAQTSDDHAEGLNRNFTNPEMDVDEWVERFEGESREVFSARHEVIAVIGLEPGDRVADIGAGTGLYTRLFAEAVGDEGWVYAVDISPGFLGHINETTAAAGMDNVTAILGRTDRSTLPPDSVDVIFICDTYHHLERVEPMLASMHDALVPGGRFVVVEFDRVEGKSREWVLDHIRAGKDVFRAEIEAAGFVFVEEIEIDGFEENYLQVFRKKK